MGKIQTDKYTTSSDITRDNSSVEYVRNKHDRSNGVRRDGKGYWVKGQSGNPNGRPLKDKSIIEKFRDNPNGEVVLKKIFDIASTLNEKDQHSDALQCAKLIIERIIPVLKSSELKMSTDDTGIIVMPSQIPAETDD